MNFSQCLKLCKESWERERKVTCLAQSFILFVFGQLQKEKDIQVSAMFFQLGQFDKKFLELFKKACLALLGCDCAAVETRSTVECLSFRQAVKRRQSAVHVRCFRKAYVAGEHLQFSSEIPKQKQQQ